MSLESLSASDLAAFALQNYGEGLCIFASTVIIAYDILLTFDREVVCIWKRRFSVVTVLFLFMRYGTLAEKALRAGANLQPRIYLPCQIVGYMSTGLSILVLASQAAFSSLRIWAIWDRYWPILVVILPVSIYPAGANLYYTALERVDPEISDLQAMLGGCWWTTLAPVKVITPLSLTTRACAIIADTAILIATLIKTWSIRQQLKQTVIHEGQSGISLSGLILRDGAWYFAALLGLNIAVLVFAVSPSVFIDNFASEFVDSLTSMLLCRLVLNLRSFNLVDEAMAAMPIQDINHIRSLRIANTALDNIGASLTGVSHNDRDEGEETAGNLVNTTLEDAMRNPLAVGLEEDLRRTERTPSTSDSGDEITEVPREREDMENV